MTEGENSSRRLVKKVLKQKNNEKTIVLEDSQKLISNMDDGINFILNNNEINSDNFYILYRLLTKDLNEYMGNSALPKGHEYRNDQVFIAKAEGLKHELIPKEMNNLFEFINSRELRDIPIVKALISHYVFEHIHPYFDFNGRMGRLLHLWILKNISNDEFRKNSYLSEAIYSYRNKFYKGFSKMDEARILNVDLTYWVANMLEIFIRHSKAYLKMQELSDQSLIKLGENTKLFIMDMLIKKDTKNIVWFGRKSFNTLYPDFPSSTTGDRVMKQIVESGLFETRSNTSQKQYKFKTIK